MAWWQWSKTAASNANSDPSMNWAEGMPPGVVNDSARAMMARTAEFRDDTNGSLLTAGTSTAYTVTTNQGFSSGGLTALDKQTITVVFHTTSGAAPTLSVDSLTAEPLRIQSGQVPPTGVFLAGTPYRFTYFNATTEFIADGAIPTSIVGSQIAPNTVANSNLTNVAAWTLKGNNTSGSAAPGDFTIDALTAKASPLGADEVPIWDAAASAMKKATFTALATLFGTLNTAPTVQRFTSGSALTYTPTAGMVRIRVRMSAGGGGGSATATNSGSNGSDSSFGTWTAVHGVGGTVNTVGGAGGSGGTNGTGTLVVRITGGAGRPAGQTNGSDGGSGGANPFGGAGVNGHGGATTAGSDGAANTGAGGGGAGSAGAAAGSGGGAGEYAEFWMTAAQVGASVTYTVGGGGNGGAAGTAAGGNGAAGVIIIEEFYI